MTFDHVVSLTAVIISFIGLVFVAVQLREGNRQRESESIVKLYDINRQLLSLAFDHPKLFPILDDAKDADPVWEKHYLQLWFNQLSLVHFYLKRSVVGKEFRESLVRDLGDFMVQKNMQRHWHKYAKAYPDSFQELVNGIIKKNEPPAAAHVDARKHQATKT